MKRQITFIVVLTVVLAALALVILNAGTSPVTAQRTSDNLSDLITELWERVLTEQTTATTSAFNFTIVFNESISGLGNSVALGQDLNRVFLERAGDDYFCVARSFSGSNNVDCMPFTNVAEVSYIER